MMPVLEISGMEKLNRWERLLVQDAFVNVYNTMCKIVNNGVMDAFNSTFEKYFANEYGANEHYDNVYVMLGCAIEKEIADKVTQIIGEFPSGKKLYLDATKPVTMSRNFEAVYFRGYIL